MKVVERCPQSLQSRVVAAKPMREFAPRSPLTTERHVQYLEVFDGSNEPPLGDNPRIHSEELQKRRGVTRFQPEAHD